MTLSMDRQSRAGVPATPGAVAPIVARPVTSPDTRAGFEVSTTASDATRAMVRLSGHVDDDGAVILAQVLDGHRRAGRRFLRLDVRGVRSLGEAALAVVHRTHATLLARRGTLILTGVDPRVEALVLAGDPDRRLFLIAPTAAEIA